MNNSDLINEVSNKIIDVFEDNFPMYKGIAFESQLSIVTVLSRLLSTFFAMYQNDEEVVRDVLKIIYHDYTQLVAKR